MYRIDKILTRIALHARLKKLRIEARLMNKITSCFDTKQPRLNFRTNPTEKREDE